MPDEIGDRVIVDLQGVRSAASTLVSRDQEPMMAFSQFDRIPNHYGGPIIQKIKEFRLEHGITSPTPVTPCATLPTKISGRPTTC